VLETEDGEIIRGTRAIFRYLESLESWRYAGAHRRKFEEHVHVRRSDGVGKLVARFGHDRPGELVPDGPDAAVVVDVPDESRYEIRLGDRRIGYAAYHRSEGTIAFTHTEVDSACEGRGFGTRLVTEALDDAHRHGLEVLPLCSFVAAVAKRRSP
jgi:predicted GNAT family acetyltransferase